MKSKKRTKVSVAKSKTKKRSTDRKSNGKIYKILTVIFGTASILLTVYSINLQKRESESRRILQQIEGILTTLSDTTTNPDVKDAARRIQNEIPKGYKFYVQSVGSIADTMEYYEKRLRGYERRIVTSIQPNQLLTKIRPRKGYVAERALFLEFLEASDVILRTENEPIRIPVKSRIPSEEIYCFSVRLSSDNYLLAEYNYLPQSTYNSLEITDVPSRDTLIVEVGVFLNIDTLNEYPRFFRKEMKLISTVTQ